MCIRDSCYDYPAALELEIEELFNRSSTEYGLLYTGYAIPNLFMPLLGGMIFDRLGTRTGLMIFTIARIKSGEEDKEFAKAEFRD